MELKPNLRSGNKEVDEYLSELENSWIEFDASNIKKLIMACDATAGILADDVILLPNLGDDQDEGRLQMLGSKKNKLFLAFKNVIADIKHFKTISDMLEELKPKIYVQEVKVSDKGGVKVKKEEPKRKNIQDFVIDKK